MKTSLVCAVVSVCLLAGGSFGAEKEKNHGRGEREDTKRVALLGVVSENVDPQLARHLKLRAGEGLVVTMVDESSPAAGVIKVDDVLKELNGQWLVNPEQLRTVVRMFKPGDEASVTLIRDGEAKKVSVKLGEREVSPQAEMQAQMQQQMMGRGGMGMQGMMSQEELMQMLRGMQGNQPRFHQRFQMPESESDDDADAKGGPSGKSEMHTSVSSSTTISKDGHTITLTDNNGDKRLKVMKGGKALFDGPVSTDAQVKGLEPEIREFYNEVSKGGASIKVKTQSSGKGRVDI